MHFFKARPEGDQGRHENVKKSVCVHSVLHRRILINQALPNNGIMNYGNKIVNERCMRENITNDWQCVLLCAIKTNLTNTWYLLYVKRDHQEVRMVGGIGGPFVSVCDI